MHQPDLYHRSNKLQRHDAEKIYKEFSTKLKWRTDGCNTLLDIGCGTGDVLMDFVYPLMPKTNPKQIMGIDISPEMIEYARHLYEGYECCEFEIMDIGSEKDYLNVMKGRQFDHITSHYCLHWVKNQKQAMKNIYELLRPNGDAILIYVINGPLHHSYKELSKSPKWSSMTKDYEKYLSCQCTTNDPKKFMEDFLEETGFKEILVEIRPKSFTFESIDSFIDFFRSICPILDRMSFERQSEFLTDCVNSLIKEGIIQIIYKDRKAAPEILCRYTILVAYVKK